MKIPESITAEQAGQAAARIIDRRRQIDDPHLDEFLAAAHEFRELLHVTLKRHRGLPDWVAEADVHDALALHVRQWWDWAADDRALLEQAEHLGMNRKDVGRLLNLTAGQAIVDRIRARRRQLASLRGDPDPDELATVAGEQDRTDAQQRWLENHRAALDQARAALLEHKHFASDEAYDSLLDVAGEPWTPATMMLMNYAAFDLSQSPKVRDLPDSHPVRQAIEGWNARAADYRTATEPHRTEIQ